MDDDKKDSPDNDDSSTSSNKSHKKAQTLTQVPNLQHGRQKSMMILQQMAPQEQAEMTQDMYAQMKQLKEHNEAMGYHGYSGYLHRHDSNQRISTDFETEVETDADFDVSNLKFENLRSRPKHPPHFKGSHSIILPETAPLKQKLENISLSINNLIKNSVDQQNKGQISNKKLNEMITYFQNQLTNIQDQIEDAENDVESHIDVKVLKYHEEIKVNKQKIKSMKKAKKEKEKQEQIKKQKEQEKIIEMQRLQIEQLTISQKSHSPQLRSRVASPEPVVHNYAPVGRARAQTYNEIPLPNEMQLSKSIGSVLPKKSPPFKPIKPRRSMQSFNILPRINQNEADSYGDGRSEEDEEELASQYMQQNVHNPGYFHQSPGMVAMNMMNPHNSMNPGMSSMSAPNPSVSYPQIQYSEGGFQMQKQQPLLSDTAVKIIGGVVIVLAGLWILSKYIDSKRNSGPPSRSRPPSRYMR